MTKRCDYLQSRFDIVGVDHCSIQEGEDLAQECLRPDGHEGPHLIRRLPRVGGQYVIWEEDLCSIDECDCGYWDWDGDVSNVCLAYGKVSDAEAEKMIRYPTYSSSEEG